MTAIKNNSLANLSDSQLIKHLDDLVQKERQTTLEILSHLIEMDRRKLYLGRGYASLFEYCTRHLGYSESAASRRIKTARCIRDFPDIYGMLLKNEVSLSIVSKLSLILNEKNKDDLLEEVRFQSARQVDVIIARFRPMSILRERARPVFVKTSFDVPEIEKDGVENSKLTPSKSAQKFTADVGGKKLDTCEGMQNRDSLLVQKFKLEFAVNPDVMKKLEEVKVLLSKKYPRGVSFEQIFEVMLDEYLEKHSSKRRDRKRNKRKSAGNKESARAGKTNKQSYVDHKRSRYIPVAVQDKVFERDNGRCTYVGADGVRCRSTWNLEIDHIKPFARGGDHSIDNLRLLCSKHNQYEAEKVYGKNFIARRRYQANSLKE